MNGEDWDGQAVRTRDGPLLGVVVGVFPQGPLAERLRVHGDYRPWTTWASTAVKAAPDVAGTRGPASVAKEK